MCVKSIFIFCICLFWLGLYQCAYAQKGTINGKAIDQQTGLVIGFANIKLNGKPYVIADSNGLFKIEIEAGSVSLEISKTGYKLYTRKVRIGYDERINITCEMEQTSNELDRVVISASRQERKIATEAVSITSIQPYLIANTNSNTLSDVLNRVPGVSVVEGQAIIRGAVGWSYNVGSRVMVLLDDMPMMGADLGDVQWDLLPIEAAENIEVIKGPSSVLYGSSASSGTISVRTGWATNKPQTRIQIYQGITDNPSRSYSAWWERTSQPFNSGMFFSHKQKIKQWDIIWSGNIDANRNHLQLNDQFRARTYLKTRYRFKSIPGLAVGIGGNLMYKKGGRFFLWEDADSNILRPFSGSTGEDFYRIWSIDPYISYSRSNYTLSVRMRNYTIRRFVDKAVFPDEEDAVATQRALDINFRRNWTSGFSIVSGSYLTTMQSVGNVYPGRQVGYSGAVYAQGEFSKGRFNTSAGLRYEVNAIGNIEDSPGPLFRTGVNYKAAKRTFIRATYGEGFRFATVGERFVEDNVRGLNILPNPGLKSETGWYTEIGIKQGFKIGEFNASIDYAFFWQEYKDLIEFRFSQWRKDSFYIDYSVTPPAFISVPGLIGFRSVNIPLTRTAGMEFTLETDGRIGQIGIRSLCGYTFTYPVDLTEEPSLQNAGNYMQNFFKSMNGLDSAMLNSILPYRNRHLVKADVELSYKRWMLGYGTFYYSVYDKIDAPLYTVVPGLKGFYENIDNGDWVHNIRAGFSINNQVTVAILVNNLLNREYAIRPARIDQPRNFNLQVRITL